MFVVEGLAQTGGGGMKVLQMGEVPVWAAGVGRALLDGGEEVVSW